MKLTSGEARWWLGLAVLSLCAILASSCASSNNHPVISKLSAEKDSVAPSDSSKVACIASDPDGDSLTYTWSATGGTFSGTGSVVTWTAPRTPGTYAITVNVTDGKAGEATMQLTIDVQEAPTNHPPVIESLAAKPSPVVQGQTTTIKCAASDPDGDELNYLWSVERGNISGEGATVTWTAPQACGSYVIKVTVTDDRGGEASRGLKIRVRKPG